jgi:ferredoxin-NADP reductase
MSIFLPPQPFTAQLTDKLKYNQRYTQFRFELIREPNVFKFKAGQYVSIQVSERGERRSYSVSSSPDITHGFEILVDVAPQGIGSKFLQDLSFGDTINFLGPLGRFILTPETAVHNKPIVFIATGSGIAPFKSMLHELLQIRQVRVKQSEQAKQMFEPRQITMHWGMRYAEDLFWLEEMQDFMQNFTNFHFNPILSRPTEDWSLSRGRVTSVLEVITLDLTADYYLCGSHEMIVAVKDILIRKSIAPEQIHHESFY